MRWFFSLLACLFCGGFASAAGFGDTACASEHPARRDGCRALAAQSGPDCVDVRRATERLACWDRLSRLSNCPSGVRGVEVSRCSFRPSDPVTVDGISLTSAATPSGGWQLEVEDRAFGEGQNIFLSTASIGPAGCGPRRRASLFLRCLDNRTAIYLIHDCATPRIGDEGWAVDLRLDDGPITRTRLTPTQMGDGFGHFSYRAARELIEQMEEAETAHVRFADIEGIGTTLRFPLTGLAEAGGTLKSACAWSDIPPWER